MTTDTKHQFDARSYVEAVAYSKAQKTFERSGQARADSVYGNYMKSGLRMWSALTSEMPWHEAEKWLRLWFGNEHEETAAETVVKSCAGKGLKPCPECWADYTVNEYRNILKKVDDSIHGGKSESNRKRQLETAVNNAAVFLAVKPDIYDTERHGRWISESEFDSMLRTLRGIVADYGGVSTTQMAA